MKKSAFGLIVLSMTFPMGCATAVGGGAPPEGTVLSIHVDKAGKLKVTDANGNLAKECGVGPDAKQPRCRGFDRNGEVLKVLPVTILRTRGSDCAVAAGFGGIAYEVC